MYTTAPDIDFPSLCWPSVGTNRGWGVGRLEAGASILVAKCWCSSGGMDEERSVGAR